jgi:uncharacterized OB-fold protein
VSGIPVSVCRACGWRGFPERLWCPRCGGDRVETEPVAGGVVELRTTVRRAAGRLLGVPVDLATVALSGGGRAVVRIEDGDGERVTTTVEHGAAVARTAEDGEA